jgi:glycosyltransferase involved in cell wall biosynthesis
VVPAFGKGKWLARCLDSLQRQSYRSQILITTSTPNDDLEHVSGNRGIPLVVNPVSRGIASDWNFALEQTRSDWVTLAHQDDWYSPQYAESILAIASEAPDSTLIFSGAVEALEGSSRTVLNPLVKRAICDAVFLGATSIRSRVRKRLLLSFGNPVPCPAVSLNRRLLPMFRFEEGWKSNLDWVAWLELATQPGAFGYVRRPLVNRTLHADAATSLGLTDRAKEDDLMLARLWPWPVSTIFGVAYAVGRWPYKKLGKP